ncbi:MAG: hypothetical protein KGN84_06795 [Acidobacteriota bacterium]|nr:hypothetical protein [Acidobacteriota bacterium]
MSEKSYLRPALLGLFAAACGALPAGAQITSVVNAASQLSGTIAPGTIVTIFGTHLATATAITPGVTSPPTTVGGVTVTVGGVAAPLYFVSPTQINAVVSFSTPLGPQTLTVTSSAGAFSQGVTIGTGAQPGIFSLLGTGTGDGAIINPLTLAIGTFTVYSGRTQTFLSIFLTGLDTTAPPMVSVGGVDATVKFAGPSPCCYGLEQINVLLPQSLSGAGRVPLVVQSGTEVSNTVEIVLLPPPDMGPFPGDEPDRPRSRELAALATIPGTSLALVADEDDDVIRVLDASTKKVINVVSLASGSGPVAVAVDAAGTVAVVAERRTGKIAIVDLTQFKVTGEVSVGAGPVDVAIAGPLAIVANGNAGTASIVDLSTSTLKQTITVGSGARGVAVDATLLKAWVTNQDSGSISVIDLTTMAVTNTISLGMNVRPGAIARIAGSNYLAVAAPVSGSSGQIFVVNINDGTFSTIGANPDLAGGASDVAIAGSTIFFADQTGGAVTAVPFSLTTGLPTGDPVTIRVDLGARALAIDAKDNLLLVVNEGSGTVALVDLTSLSVVGRIDGVASQMHGDDESDDHSDHDNAHNNPTISAVAPATASANSTFNLVVTGTNLSAATGVLFVNPASVHGNGKGQGKGDSPLLNADNAFVVTNLSVNSTGTILTATVTATNAAPGPRIVLVTSANGESAFSKTTANVLLVTP